MQQLRIIEKNLILLIKKNLSKTIVLKLKKYYNHLSQQNKINCLVNTSFLFFKKFGEGGMAKLVDATDLNNLSLGRKTY